MQEGLARLHYLVESATLGLVTGPSGAGKSTLLKRFLHDLPRQQCETVYCHLTHLKSTGLMKTLISQLGENPQWGKERLFQQILDRAARSESTLLIIIDEAHLLDGETLTDLRLLVSSAIDAGPPLKLLLVGQLCCFNCCRQGANGGTLRIWKRNPLSTRMIIAVNGSHLIQIRTK